jgi:hypothetical protein
MNAAVAAQVVSTPTLEPAAQAFADATSKPPFLFDLPPAEGRKAVDDVQSGPISKPDVDIEDITVEGGPTGQVQGPGQVGEEPFESGWNGEHQAPERLVRCRSVARAAEDHYQ